MSTSPEQQDEIRQLFQRTVPEIAAGQVEIVAVARKVGHRAYVAVRSAGPAIDPVDACTGPSGVRLKAMVSGLPGDHLTVIRWEDSPERFIKNCLRPLNVISVSLEPAKQEATIKCERSTEGRPTDGRYSPTPDQELGLISELAGWHIRLEGDSSSPG